MRSLQFFPTQIILALWLLVPLWARCEDEPPREIESPNHQYSVRMLDHALPGYGPDRDFFTIAVRHGNRDVAKYPTEGYLLEAFWSPDGKYVAVDNRRANSGDYLWVFRLSDGFALKTPVDAPHPRSEDIRANVDRVMARYPELGDFRKLFVFAHGWTKSGELQVKTNLAFGTLDKAIGVVLETYRIEKNNLVLVDRKIGKEPWPPKKK